MANALRPGDILQNKRNVNPSLDPYTEARAEDFDEVSTILNDHADKLDAMVQPTKFYGFHTSLPNLAAAYPAPEADGWAVIIPTNGNSPFVATFTNGAWTASEVQAPIQYFATKTARPPEGQEGIFYVVKDQKLLTLWYDNKYNDFGKDGANGASAYQVAVAFGFSGTEPEWLDSLKGAPGKSAYQTAVDNGFEGTEAEWIASVQGVEGKSAYAVAVDNGYTGTETEWLESLEGEKGDEGDSAYQVAVNNGFIGTVAEWLESLNGEPGDDGRSAYQVAVDNGFQGTEAEWIASIEGVEGKSAYDVAVVNGFVGTEAEWLLSLKGEPGTNGLTQDDIDEVIIVNTSRDLAATDIGKVLFITATVTLTYPAGGIPKFKCNIMCSETGLGTLSGQAAELDFPDGQIIEARKAVTLFLRPDDSRLTGYGEFTA